MPITRSEVGRGPKTTHCIPSFLWLVRSPSQVAGCSFDWHSFWLWTSHCLSREGRVWGFWSSHDKMNLFLPPPPRGSVIFLWSSLPPSMTVYWQSIFYTTLLCTLLTTTDPPQFLLKTIRSPQKDSSACYPPPPRWIMTGASTKTQKRKGSVAYIFCLLFQLSLIWRAFLSPSSPAF